ncbi:unnamed protein product [Prorocentrum cordatum]|uniref:Uncharacterized protein n=1 Tax=Prorocentrum cordatum TaxID=2364126 RepID=A0ABN9QPU9_9DINO|nr:unnamed protein product [Polarella glacialis]
MVATSRASTPRPPAAAKSAAAASSAATPAESPAGAQARAKAAANPADRAIAATRAPVPRAAPAAAPLSPLRCPSCVCAFAVWQTVLFAVEVLYYAQPGQALWAIGMGGHSALATLVVLMTVLSDPAGLHLGGRPARQAIEEDLKDLNNIPCFGARAASAFTAAKGAQGVGNRLRGHAGLGRARQGKASACQQAAVGKPLWGVFGSQAFVLPLSLYLSVCSGYLASKSLAPLSQYLWCSVFLLSTVFHVLNIIRIIFSLTYGLTFGRTRAATKSSKEG